MEKQRSIEAANPEVIARKIPKKTKSSVKLLDELECVLRRFREYITNNRRSYRNTTIQKRRII